MSQRLDQHVHRGIAVILCAATVVFLLAPVLVTVPLAFSDQTYVGLADSSLTTRWFSNLNRTDWRRAIGTSLVLGMASALAATVLAAPLAFWILLHSTTVRAKLLKALILGILIVPPIWIAIGYFRLFGEGNSIALLMGHILLSLPLAFACMWYGMSRLDHELYHAARMLGASHWSTLWQVYLPASGRFVVAAFFVAFLTSWDESVLALLIANPHTQTVPKIAFESLRLDRDFTVAALDIFAAAMLAAVLVVLMRRVED